MTTLSQPFRTTADSIGLFGSTLCALHCLLAPTLLTLGTTLPVTLFADESFHAAMLWVIWPSALAAFALGCWRHRDWMVLSLGVAGLIVLTAAGLLHDVVGESGERYLTLAAAAALVTAHVRNFRLCRTSDCDDELCDPEASVSEMTH